MFFNTQLLISTLLAVSVLGAPSAKRDDADPCKGLGAGAYSNLAAFRVASLHPGRNQNEWGNDVVLQTTGLNSTTFREAHWETSPSPKDLTLVNGGITTPSGSDIAAQVSDNDVPYFAEGDSKPPTASIWCGVPANDVSGKHKFDFLAAHGRYDLWSSCQKKISETDSVFRIAYNVDKTKTSAMFDVETCVPVTLTIVKNQF